MLWPSLGGHWVELWFLNWLRPRLPVARGAQIVTRLGVAASRREYGDPSHGPAQSLLEHGSGAWIRSIRRNGGRGRVRGLRRRRIHARESGVVTSRAGHIARVAVGARGIDASHACGIQCPRCISPEHRCPVRVDGRTRRLRDPSRMGAVHGIPLGFANQRGGAEGDGSRVGRRVDAPQRRSRNSRTHGRIPRLVNHRCWTTLSVSLRPALYQGSFGSLRRALMMPSRPAPSGTVRKSDNVAAGDSGSTVVNVDH